LIPAARERKGCLIIKQRLLGDDIDGAAGFSTPEQGRGRPFDDFYVIDVRSDYAESARRFS
jgi:hypothetical protein